MYDVERKFENFQNKYEKDRRMHLDTRKSPLQLLSGREDGTPAHDSKRMQDWLKRNLTEVWVEEVWPPSSPDCNLFDYFVCGVSKVRVSAKSHSRLKDLIQKMKEVMGPLVRETPAKACRSFRSRI